MICVTPLDIFLGTAARRTEGIIVVLTNSKDPLIGVTLRRIIRGSNLEMCNFLEIKMDGPK